MLCMLCRYHHRFGSLQIQTISNWCCEGNRGWQQEKGDRQNSWIKVDKHEILYPWKRISPAASKKSRATASDVCEAIFNITPDEMYHLFSFVEYETPQAQFNFVTTNYSPYQHVIITRNHNWNETPASNLVNPDSPVLQPAPLLPVWRPASVNSCKNAKMEGHLVQLAKRLNRYSKVLGSNPTFPLRTLRFFFPRCWRFEMKPRQFLSIYLSIYLPITLSLLSIFHYNELFMPSKWKNHDHKLSDCISLWSRWVEKTYYHCEC